MNDRTILDPGITDAEPWEADPLAPATGCVYGVLAGLLAWFVLAAVAYVAWRLIR